MQVLHTKKIPTSLFTSSWYRPFHPPRSSLQILPRIPLIKMSCGSGFQECSVNEVHLKRFIAGFVESPVMEEEDLKFHLYGSADGLEKLCKDAVIRPFKVVRHKSDICILVLKVPQKKIVSRKTQIATYL